MFTGIIEEVGEVEAAVRRRDVLAVRIRARVVTTGLPRGGSIAVDGCCLTAVETDGDGFACDLTAETLDRTNLRAARPGDRVNLEIDVIAKYVERLIAPASSRA